MVAIAKILFIAMGASAAHAMKITSSCPSGQTLISNNKCCPGYAIIGDGNDATKTVCCVTDQGSGNCQGVGVCGDSLGKSCKAKVDVTDSNYDQEVQAALSGTAASQTGSSSAPPIATATPTASSTPSSSSFSSSSSSDSDSGSSSSTDSSSSSSQTNAATSDAVEGKKATLAMVAALAAVPVAFYGL
ncbi:hypothetical protein F5Y05DRAFT_257972 [Hypoxylon sp. FL0543]|nr:hypothetical protein F5Y05DRAFT_257972 [Hypoxylon sp. FL0543]